MRSLLAIVAALAATAAALPSANVPHVLHEKRGLTHSVWTKRSEVPAAARLPVRIGLTQSNLDKGHDLLMEISRHDSPRYGQHYTADQVTELFAPSHETVNAVSEWLRAAGIQHFAQSVNKQWLQLDLRADELASLLRTKYHEWEHTETGDVHVACDEYHVPEHLVDHIDYITPGIKLHSTGSSSGRKQKRGLKKKRSFKLPPLMGPLPPGVVLSSGPTNINQCDRIVEPQCVRALYNITIPTTACAGNALGIFEDLGDIYDQADMNLFFKTLTSIPKGTKPVPKLIDGAKVPTAQSNAGGESLLDLSISFPLIYPQEIWLYQTDDLVYENNYTYDGFLNNFFDAIDGSYCTYSAYGETGNSPLDPVYPDPQYGGYKGKLQCGKYSATNVISISYGGQEVYLPVAYQRRQCAEIMKLAMQGTTVVVSSGDSGVGEARGTNIANCLGVNGTVFSPDFPASCPYLVAVGSTYLPRGAKVAIDAEVATNRFPSGGGFSNIYPTPDYQQSAVNTFLEFYNPYPTYSIKYKREPTAAEAGPGIFNRGGRGYPDIGALGDNVILYYKGSPYFLGGTSVSAPVVASIFTRINEERLLAGKGPIGYVNPTLYAHPEAFHDITSGSNPNCASPGFTCSPGWDPVTGLGTPNYPSLLEIFMALP